MICYKMVNNRFEVVKVIEPNGIFDNTSKNYVGSLNNLRDISPVEQDLTVVTATDGLSIIQIVEGDFITKNITVNQMNENSDGFSTYEFFEVSTNSEMDDYQDFLSPRALSKGVTIYYNKENNIVSISSIETFLKLAEALGLTLVP